MVVIFYGTGENSRENGAVYLKKGEGRSMKAGGPWVYDNEVERIEGEPLDGDVVSVHAYNGF